MALKEIEPPEDRLWHVMISDNKRWLEVHAQDPEIMRVRDRDWLQTTIDRATELSEIAEGEHDSRLPHPQAERVVREILPAAVDRYLTKAGDYGDDEPELGAAGEFAQIYGKVRKLKRVLWQGHTLTGEPPIEVMEDLIAHIALAIDYVKRNNLNAPDSRD